MELEKKKSNPLENNKCIFMMCQIYKIFITRSSNMICFYYNLLIEYIHIQDMVFKSIGE